MNRAYLETSVFNRAADASLSAAHLRRAARALALRPVVGLHAIYELSRTFLDPAAAARGAKLFTLVRDLEPSFQWDPASLLRAELQRLRMNTAVVPFLDHHNYIATRQEVCRLASGTLSADGREFIERRESDIARNFPRHSAWYIQTVTHKQNSGNAPAFRTYDQVLGYFTPSYPQMIQALMPVPVSVQEAREFAARLDSFPMTRSVLRSNLYLAFICLAKHVPPGDDKLDDTRQVTEAAYCETFITGDPQQAKIASRINPSLHILSFEELANAATA